MKDAIASTMSTDNNPVDIWQHKFHNDTLVSRDFREYWRIHVPRMYAPDERTNFLHQKFDEQTICTVLFEPIEQFMFMDTAANAIQYLKSLAAPTALCGKVFRLGEATYSCRDCGQDGACVLCRDCFKSSAHQNHRYKMNQSVGGGFCDCGDKEAWKEGFASCSLHSSGDEESGVCSLRNFPIELVQRTKAVFLAVVEYTLEILTYDNTMILPHDLRMEPESSEFPDELFGTTSHMFSSPLYTTIIYNDETHTFEQVIDCLKRAIGCSQRDAIDYATFIDRVGRSIIKCGDFQTCNHVKDIVDNYSTRNSTRLCKVQVVHTHLLAHQTFALKLLLWLRKLVEEVNGFKALFSELVTQPAHDGPFLERAMKADTQLWKQARNEWYSLFIKGMLLESGSKKLFAITFTRLYSTLMRDFMTDDHNHSDSITSLSVQIYTVPTIATMLISKEDCLSIITRIFLRECLARCNSENVLMFDQRVDDYAWKRILYCIYDLRYLLSMCPTEWDDELRDGFLAGFHQILKVLAVMEGMDASVRQTGEHLEFDPDWQTAFTLFGKISAVICQLIDWCCSDKQVFVKAYRAILRKLQSKISVEKYSADEVVFPTLSQGDQVYRIINFDMWKNPVSLHLPLTRIFTGLHMQMDKFSLSFASNELQIESCPTIKQLVETSLRAIILTFQVRAGMWRRNGTSLISQVHFYSNVRLRSEIQDRDIQMLQIGASLMDPDEFIYTLLRRFNIDLWLNDNFELSLKQTSSECGDTLQADSYDNEGYAQKVHEYLHNLEDCVLLLIQTFGERYQPGVGQVTKTDCFKKEIIQLLCIEPAPHSKLCKHAASESPDSASIEDLAGQVAVFRQNSGKGYYELRPEYLKEYNLFWYHYSREEQSKSEGAQLKLRKTTGAPYCLPPPHLPPFTKQFHLVRNIVLCNAFMQVVNIVLKRSLDPTTNVFSEILYHRTLFLIGMALNEEERNSVLANQSASSSEVLDLSFRFSQLARQHGIYDNLVAQVSNQRTCSHVDLLHWTLDKFSCLLAPKSSMQPATTASDSGDGTLGHALPPGQKDSAQQQPGAEDLTQAHSKQLTATNVLSDTQKRRRHLAASHKAKILSQIQAQQRKFMKKNHWLLSEQPTCSTDSTCLEAASSSRQQHSSPIPDALQTPCLLGLRQSPPSPPSLTFTCILCQATDTLCATSADSRTTIVLAAFVQTSTVLSRERVCRETTQQSPPLLHMCAGLHGMPHISSCGHAMHSECWIKHFQSVVYRERRRALRNRNRFIFDVKKHEFLCPLCQCLSNTVIPVIPTSTSCVNYDPSLDHFDTWLYGLQLACQHSEYLVDPGWNSKLLTSHVKYPNLSYLIENLSSSQGNCFSNQILMGNSEWRVSVPIREIMNTFAIVPAMIATGSSVDFGDCRVLLISLQSVAYTIHSTEHMLRALERPLLAGLGSRLENTLSLLAHYTASCVPVVCESGAVHVAAYQVFSRLLGTHSQGPCILELDAFGTLITVSAMAGMLFSSTTDNYCAPNGSLTDLNCVRLCLLLHIVQIMVSVDAQLVSSWCDIDMDSGMMDQSMRKSPARSQPSEDEMTSDDQQDTVTSDNQQDAVADRMERERLWVAELYSTVQSALGPGSLPDVQNTQALYSHVCVSIVPFLRCCVLYYRYLTNIDVPSSLQSVVCFREQYTLLLEYLGLNTIILPQVLDRSNLTTANTIIHRWCNHAKLRLMSRLDTIVRYPLTVNSLISLPTDFSELIDKVSDFTCPNSEGESRVPAMCLVCGKLLCSQSYCCQVQVDSIGQIGACNAHLITCGAGVGIMLRIRECRVHLLVDKVRGTNFTPPYVDKFGEVDHGLVRGNPLKLWREQYGRLNQLWLSHGIPEEVARSTEPYTQIDWHNM